eukprot:CAMPEP_0168455972 /NCGR_PEP_ID=MMETSP0228-20121227/51039_1 /TAXON_ID=133427 /ORGANISM="Protoceratium reticulatum, Strain CCCM 535 (=CCMP 1889)" /LENGTH=41 /DNA_ID= /DNA_START= /DNA_END= /DNA_ORIENTATION=
MAMGPMTCLGMATALPGGEAQETDDEQHSAGKPHIAGSFAG